MRKLILFALLLCGFGIDLAHARTWFVRADGGTRYSSNVPTGQCNGQYDAPYPGSGVNQNCAYNDFRYLYDDDSGHSFNTNNASGNYMGTWVINGGDTVVIRGCTALPTQVNPSNPACRIGWDAPTQGGSTSGNLWCKSASSDYCTPPPVPSGTSSNPTRILGACAYGTYTCNPVGHSYPYTSNNLTQIFCGFDVGGCIDLQGSSYVQIEGIELTTHNQHYNGTAWSGNCTWWAVGSPAYPVQCVGGESSSFQDDYGVYGFTTSPLTTNVTMQDVYVHGFTDSGFFGPIGANIALTNVFIGFNAFAAWNLNDANDDPNGTNASLSLNYVWMEGNGCYEQYPIVNTQFPARACYDTESNGFGDSLSGQDTGLPSLTYNHTVTIFNTKDGFIGPHVQIASQTIENSFWYGNMGNAIKYGSAPNSTSLFQNNLIVNNCMRMSQAVPGAVQNFNNSTGLGGSYLSLFCRAEGSGVVTVNQSGSANYFYGNTFIGAAVIMAESECGFPAGSGCGGNAVPIIWEDNVFLGYADPVVGQAPTLYYSDGAALAKGSYNVEYRIRNGDTCGGNIICSDPLLKNEPAQTWPGSEAALDVFNPFNAGNSFELTASSPAIGAGTVLSGLTTDYYGVSRPNPPSMGALECIGLAKHTVVNCVPGQMDTLDRERLTSPSGRVSLKGWVLGGLFILAVVVAAVGMWKSV
jgi:hypothetical protein